MDQIVCSRVDHAIAGLLRSREPLTVMSLAASLGMSRYQLARYFETEQGKPLSLYIREQQFARAIELLETTDLPIKRIALLSGCGTERTLRRLFRQFADVTPSGWRRS